MLTAALFISLCHGKQARPACQRRGWSGKGFTSRSFRSPRAEGIVMLPKTCSGPVIASVAAHHLVQLIIGDLAQAHL